MGASLELTVTGCRKYLDELLEEAQELQQQILDHSVSWRDDPARRSWLKKEFKRVQSRYESMLEYFKDKQ